jgi:hypothetical protein
MDSGVDDTGAVAGIPAMCSIIAAAGLRAQSKLLIDDF